MNYVRLGKSGLEVSELVFGTLAVGRLQGKLSPAEGAKVIVRGVELGIDCIDSAQVYGSYEHIAAALVELGAEGER
ncbi:MAG: aldo/keto reductase, partial [Candidatus Eisenbacteria bacterium]|nr:aldo/keto reductase [Candidatus Eisenbacteria bacterium]